MAKLVRKLSVQSISENTLTVDGAQYLSEGMKVTGKYGPALITKNATQNSKEGSKVIHLSDTDHLMAAQFIRNRRNRVTFDGWYGGSMFRTSHKAFPGTTTAINIEGNAVELNNKLIGDINKGDSISIECYFTVPEECYIEHINKDTQTITLNKPLPAKISKGQKLAFA